MMMKLKIKEKMHTNVNAMLNIMLDEIVRTGSIKQEGEKDMGFRMLDRWDNLYELQMSLKVTPASIASTPADAQDIEDLIKPTVEERLDAIERDIGMITQILETLASIDDRLAALENASQDSGNQDSDPTNPLTNDYYVLLWRMLLF